MRRRFRKASRSWEYRAGRPEAESRRADAKIQQGSEEQEDMTAEVPTLESELNPKKWLIQTRRVHIILNFPKEESGFLGRLETRDFGLIAFAYFAPWREERSLCGVIG